MIDGERLTPPTTVGVRRADNGKRLGSKVCKSELEPRVWLQVIKMQGQFTTVVGPLVCA
jgi:hypothetical protein